ncbi:MAG: hypothetical protein PHR60_03815 [Eubacteriales bacterium]|nr:hypothetical protein [Eubacteriales bacterium]
MENVVYFELLRRDYDVFIGKVEDREVDFIATRQDDKKYYQVTASLLSTDVKKRELESLKRIDDNYEKVILTMDKSYLKSIEGIKIINIIDFLLE